MGQRGELPLLTPGLAAAHQRVAPVEIAVVREVYADLLVDPRISEGNQRLPVARQPGIAPDVVRAQQARHARVGGRMHLQGRLRRQPHARAPLQTDALLEAIATERAGGGRGENDVKALALNETPSDSEPSLRIRLRH